MHRAGVCSRGGSAPSRLRLAVVAAAVVVVAATFAVLCVAYDAQLYHTPANFVRDHRRVAVLPVFGRRPALREPGRRRVLLVAYHRGGSTFLGELFGANADAFYWYEPLRNMYREFPAALRTHVDVVESLYRVAPNGSLTYLPSDLLDVLITTISDVLSCDVTHVDRHVLTEEFMLRWVHMPRVRAYAECMIASAEHVFGAQACAGVLRAACRQSAAVVAKTVRLPVYALGELLRRDGGLKVVYYVRDPRAVLVSRADRFGESDERVAAKARPFCRQMAQDYRHYDAARRSHPDNVLLVKYEELARRPLDVARLIYDHVGVGLPASVERWIADNTNADSDDGRIGTMRNSTATADRWRRLISRTLAERITDACREVLDIHGYEI